MDINSIEHIIYAPVPYKGYSIRAKTRTANVDSFRNGFKDYLIPFDQSIIHKDFIEKVIVIGNGKVYLARVFQANGLDELKRSGVVSHIAEIPVDLIIQNKLQLRSIDYSMQQFTELNGVPIGEIERLNIPIGIENDIGIDNERTLIRETIPEDSLRKLIKQTESQKFKQCIVYKNLDVDIILYGLARIISLISSKWILFSSANIKNDFIFLFDGVFIFGKTLPAWARNARAGWSVLNLQKECSYAIKGNPIDDEIQKIYDQ
jgi:hypothetical protein